MIITVSLALGLANIIVSNMVATSGQRLQELEEKSAQLNSENQELARIISERKSLTAVEEKAEKLGLVPISETMNLLTPEPLAQAP